MQTAYRKDVSTLFDVFCEVGATIDDGTSIILQKYPEDFSDCQTLKSIGQFCFPCGPHYDNWEAVQMFTFVLTDEKSEYTYAFCRLTPHNNTCLCILSGLQWPNVFYKILNHLSEIMNNRVVFGPFLCQELITAIYQVLITAPDLTKLPSLREDKFMFEFFNGITEKQLITIYAGLLKERRILFTSQKLSQLSSCVFGAAALLRPMHWQSLFIPVLPFHLIDMLIIDLGDVMVIDLDLRTVHCIFNDVVDLPSEALSILYKGLSCSAVTFSWDCKKFIHNQKPSLQSYLRSLIEEDGVQYLERFIDERIAALNAGEPIDDEFEKEIRAMEMQSKSSHQVVISLAKISVIAC
ncbi:unnamed protein product [Thelazia callipaeda]|uniref:UDENN domain-containing protein n=1 Tax=Thelazia callipaeda TaxID=103827 RepID=A0A0N5DA84_THECL|nr:unnamed protein product [Thelazia callipaeda]